MADRPALGRLAIPIEVDLVNPPPARGRAMLHPRINRRRLGIERLEDRRMLATYTVTTNLDVVDENDGVLSLREAVIAANATTEVDEVVFDFGHDGPETILLTQGEIMISESLSITGPGPELLTIDASGSDPTPDEDNGDGSRVFNAGDNFGNDEHVQIAISGIRLTGGDAKGTGGAIRAVLIESLAVRDVVVEFNHATASGDSFPLPIGGGGIGVFATDVVVEDSIVRSNKSANRESLLAGAALSINGGDLNCVNSQFNSNHGGYAIVIESGSSFRILDCDVSGNSGKGLSAYTSTGSIEGSRFEGNGEGGIAVGYVFQPIVISDTLIVGDGVGVDVFFRTPNETSEVVLINSTIVSSGDPAIHVTGLPLAEFGQVKILSSTVQGDVIDDVGFSLTSFNSIIVGALTTPTFNHQSTLTVSHSFIGSTEALPETGLTSPDADGNYVGGRVGGAIDPLLGPLAYNGGPTRTLRPLPNSPVINTGDPAFDPNDPYPEVGEALLHDGRGAPFDRVVGGRVDMGAVEYNPQFRPGDFNGDLTVDMADYVVWRNTLGAEVSPLSGADGSGDGVIDALDYLVWKSHYGEVYLELPEEAALAMADQVERPEAPLVLPVPASFAKRGEFRSVERAAIEPSKETKARDEALLLLATRPAPRQQILPVELELERAGDDEHASDEDDAFELLTNLDGQVESEL